MEQLGNEHAWKDFIGRWEKYLAQLPHALLEARVPGYEAKLRQVHYWIRVLPQARSAERVAKGIGECRGFIEELWGHVDSNDSMASLVRDEAVLCAADPATLSFSEGAFGFFVPGFPIPLRARRTLDEALRRVEQMEALQDGLAPHLRAEIQRIRKAGVPWKFETLYEYLRSFERAWSRQHFFKQRASRAVSVHGFFPFHMPSIDLQDRILALTSVTMHGWNAMREEDFFRETKAALAFLKPGGKYILGPINQYVYFFGRSSAGEFDAEGLTRALERLQKEGVLDYEFHKGQREPFADSGYGDDAEEAIEYDPNPRVLHDTESAYSLVITRLR
jgi:hypothetical protein